MKKIGVKRATTRIGMMLCLHNWCRGKDGVGVIIVVTGLSELQDVRPFIAGKHVLAL